MSTPVLIIGKSGSGKSRSIVGLDPTKTVVFQCCNKDLPFKSWKTKYMPKQNLVDISQLGFFEKACDNIIKISKNAPHITTIVIDDFQYSMSFEYMRRKNDEGKNKYLKFDDIASWTHGLIDISKYLRDDIIVFFLTHSEIDEFGNTKMKTIGKFLDDKICVEGLFTIVLNSVFKEGKYIFETKPIGSIPTKTPEGMFEKDTIENNLQIVSDAIKAYNLPESTIQPKGE
jgi:hypothetical protein